MTAKRDTRERLVHAAADLFWAEGYAGTSLADIAAAAKVPTGNVFYHFRTKADLAQAVGALFTAATRETLAEIARDLHDPTHRIGRLLDLLAEATQSRVVRGCPLARGSREFPKVADGSGSASEPFALMIEWLARELVATGRDAGIAASLARGAIARWQGAIVLAHGFGDGAMLTGEIEAIRRDLVGFPVQPDD